VGLDDAVLDPKRLASGEHGGLMTSLQSISAGIKEVGGRKKIVWAWYGTNLLSALVIVGPLVIAIAGALGESLENHRLFDNFDLSWITEFGWSARWEQLTVWLPVAAMIGALFVLMTTWLSGGLLAILRDPKDSFFAGCARWFPPFLRLFLMALFGYAIAFGLRVAVGALARKTGEASMSAQPSAYLSMFGFVLFWTVALFVNLIVDYAKIRMVVTGDRKARSALRAAFRFVFANFWRTVTIYSILTGYGLLMLGAYHGLSEVIGQTSVGAVLLLLLIRQVYMLGRTWLRMVFLASEHVYFSSLIPQTVAVQPAAELEPPPPLQESFEFNESI
jgi:hypothetical protein